jgi:glucose-6-phosphate 1-dehydrogenase
MFRFANMLFEPVWNNRYIDHVQITVSESLGVGMRAGYYDSSGVIRDMFQNHIMQLVALTAMEPPSESDAGLVRDEKAKVFRSVRPFDLADPGACAVLGQYGPGVVGGQPVGGYLDEPGVPAGSSTPTFGAFKLFIDNWRWEGVPFYLRSGKRMTARKAEIAVQFKDVPHMMFTRQMSERAMGNVMVFRVQPDDGINLLFQTKHPGSKICLNPVRMDFTYPRGFQLSGYERVLLDCLEGDQMLFVREDGVTLNWALWSPLIDRLDETTTAANIPKYPAGSECPREALEFMHRDGRVWRRL